MQKNMGNAIGHYVDAQIFSAPAKPSYRAVGDLAQRFLPDHIKLSAGKVVSNGERKRAVPFVCIQSLRAGAATETHILYSHGNAEDLGQILKTLIDMSDELGGATVWAYEYTGYAPGDDRTDSSEERVIDDAMTIVRHVKAQSNCTALVIYGRSRRSHLLWF